MKLFLLITLLFCTISTKKISDSNGVGFAFSGAGGRLAQHLGLMEVLVKGLNPSKTPVRPSFISGASSGAISAVVLNAILETEDKNLTNGLTWEEYKKDLFALRNSDVYDTSYEGLAMIFVYNIPHGYILDNSNLKVFLKKYANKVNYKKLGDLYLPTSISIMNQSSGHTERLWSTDPKYAELDLLEVVMASTSIPIAFPTTTITGLGKTKWIDGGTGIDTIPVFPLLHRPEVTDVYALSYASALLDGGSGDLPFILDDIDILSNSLAAINDIRVDLFEAAIEMAATSTKKAFTFIPTLNQTFSSLEFDYEKLQYELTYEWAIQHDPTPIKRRPLLKT